MHPAFPEMPAAAAPAGCIFKNRPVSMKKRKNKRKREVSPLSRLNLFQRRGIGPIRSFFRLENGFQM
jgi:hypothetical protein